MEARWDRIQPELAATLKRIRDNGAKGFYEGETARLIVEEMQRGKGMITYDDLKNIRSICCKVRPPYYPAVKPKRQPLIITNQTAEIVQEAANNIKNQKLKEILLRIAERNIEKL